MKTEMIKLHQGERFSIWVDSSMKKLSAYVIMPDGSELQFDTSHTEISDLAYLINNLGKIKMLKEPSLVIADSKWHLDWALVVGLIDGPSKQWLIVSNGRLYSRRLGNVLKLSSEDKVRRLNDQLDTEAKELADRKSKLIQEFLLSETEELVM